MAKPYPSTCALIFDGAFSMVADFWQSLLQAHQEYGPKPETRVVRGNAEPPRSSAVSDTAIQRLRPPPSSLAGSCRTFRQRARQAASYSFASGRMPFRSHRNRLSPVNRHQRCGLARRQRAYKSLNSEGDRNGQGKRRCRARR